tara:strand:- start:421 stop:642 length:222 start_codon:yes stop_codon:yes gene_type:complete
MIRDTNNSADDEFGFNYISEVEFNKRHKKALKKADSSYKEKNKKKKKLYEPSPLFKGLGGSNKTNRGPLGNKE